MPITSEEYSNAWVVAVGGDLAGRETLDLRAGVELRVRRPGVVHVIIDMAAARFVDSDGLQNLLTLQKRCEERGGSLSLARLTPECVKILEITRLEQRFEICDSLATALKAVA